MIGGMQIPGFANIAKTPRSTASSARSGFYNVRSPGTPASSARLEYASLDPVDLDEDILLVSQIGGLRAKSAQAQAASAKLTAAIDSAREHRSYARVHRQQCRQTRLTLLSSWLASPSEKAAHFFVAWRLAIVNDARLREAERAKLHEERSESKLQKLRGQILTERLEARLQAVLHCIKSGQKRDLCRAAPLDLPLGAAARDMASFCFGIWQWSWRLQRRGNSRRLRTGSVQVPVFVPRPSYQNLTTCLSPRSSGAVASAVARKLRSRTGTSPESPISQTTSYSPQRSMDQQWRDAFADRFEKFVFARHACGSLLGLVFWVWRQWILAVACAAAAHPPQECDTLHGDLSCWRCRKLQSIGPAARGDEVCLILHGRATCALDGMFSRLNYFAGDQLAFTMDAELCGWLLWHWRLFSALQCRSGATREVTRVGRVGRLIAYDKISLSLAGCALIAAFTHWKAQIRGAAIGRMLIRQRRCLTSRWLSMYRSLHTSSVLALWASIAFISKSESVWSAKLTHMRVLQRRALSAVLSSVLDTEQSCCASLIFYIWSLETLRSRCHQLQKHLEDSADSSSAIRLYLSSVFQSSQNNLQRECLAFLLSAWRLWQSRQRKRVMSNSLASFDARSSFVQSMASLEHVFWLRNVFEVFAMHANTAFCMRQLKVHEQHIVDSFAAERDIFYSRRSRHADRIYAHKVCRMMQELRHDCFHRWLREVGSASFLKRCTKIIAWSDSVPQFRCWFAWQSWYFFIRRVAESEARYNDMIAQLASEKLHKEKLVEKTSRREVAFGKLCCALTGEIDQCSDRQAAVEDAIRELVMSPATENLTSLPDDAIAQLQSPLTATNDRVVNVWNGPPCHIMAGSAAPPTPPPGMELAQSLDPMEQRFIRRCGELTRQQEDFISKLRANTRMLPDELRSQQSNSVLSASAREMPSVVGRGAQCTWHDASEPLSARKLDIPQSSQPRYGEPWQALETDLTRQGSLDPSAGYWGDVSLPLFDGQQVEGQSSGTDVVRRRLSFGGVADGSINVVTDSPATLLQELADRETSTICHDEINGRLHPDMLAPPLEDHDARQTSGTCERELLGGETQVDFHLTKDALCQPINPMDEGLCNQVRQIAESSGQEHVGKVQEEDAEKSPVWRWHTWSAGDVPPSEADDDDLEMVHIQTAQGSNGELEAQYIRPVQTDESSQSDARRPTGEQLAELRRILEQGLPELMSNAEKWMEDKVCQETSLHAETTLAGNHACAEDVVVSFSPAPVPLGVGMHYQRATSLGTSSLDLTCSPGEQASDDQVEVNHDSIPAVLSKLRHLISANSLQ